MKTNCAVATLSIVVLLVTAASTYADKEKNGKQPELTDLTLTGKVTSEQVEKKGKDGSTNTYTVYYLNTDDAKIALPQPRSKKKGETPPFELSTFVNANVKVSAKGFTRPSKKGGTSTHIHQIVSIERVATET